LLRNTFLLIKFKYVNFLMIFLILAIPVTTVTLFVVQNNVPQTKCPNNCSGNGTCNTDGKCSCSATYTGEDCSQKVPDHCNGKGTYNEANGTCTCNAGYFGTACEIDCSLCEKNGGICDTKSGKCNCKPNFDGLHCEKCKQDWYPVGTCDKNCTSTTCGAYGKCDATNGLPCVCDEGVLNDGKGGNCNICDTAKGYYDFSKGCKTRCDAATTCNGNGKCDQDKGTCTCNNSNFSSETCKGQKAGSLQGGGGNCKTGWEGDKCDQAVCPWGMGDDGKNQECSGRGTCTNGKCVDCKDGYYGNACETSPGLGPWAVLGIIAAVGIALFIIWKLFFLSTGGKPSTKEASYLPPVEPTDYSLKKFMGKKPGYVLGGNVPAYSTMPGSSVGKKSPQTYGDVKSITRIAAEKAAVKARFEPFVSPYMKDGKYVPPQQIIEGLKEIENQRIIDLKNAERIKSSLNKLV